MGEYADLEIERQQRETGRRLMREVARDTNRIRWEAGAQQAASNLATHTAREEAIAAALLVVETHAPALAVLGLIVERTGRRLEARRGASVIGQWCPDKLHAIIRSRPATCTDTYDWLRAVMALDLGPRS